jgi:hypothetical protein
LAIDFAVSTSGQRGDAGVGGLQNLHAVADAVEQVADVLARASRPAAVKKLVGLSSALLTFRWRDGPAWSRAEPYPAKRAGSAGLTRRG